MAHAEQRCEFGPDSVPPFSTYDEWSAAVVSEDRLFAEPISESCAPILSERALLQPY